MQVTCRYVGRQTYNTIHLNTEKDFGTHQFTKQTNKRYTQPWKSLIYDPRSYKNANSFAPTKFRHERN